MLSLKYDISWLYYQFCRPLELLFMSSFFETASHFGLHLLWCSWKIFSKHFAESGWMFVYLISHKNSFIYPTCKFERNQNQFKKGVTALFVSATWGEEVNCPKGFIYLPLQWQTSLNTTQYPSSLGSRARHLSFPPCFRDNGKITIRYSTGWRFNWKKCHRKCPFLKGHDTCHLHALAAGAMKRYSGATLWYLLKLLPGVWTNQAQSFRGSSGHGRECIFLKSAWLVNL